MRLVHVESVTEPVRPCDEGCHKGNCAYIHIGGLQSSPGCDTPYMPRCVRSTGLRHVCLPKRSTEVGCAAGACTCRIYTYAVNIHCRRPLFFTDACRSCQSCSMWVKGTVIACHFFWGGITFCGSHVHALHSVGVATYITATASEDPQYHTNTLSETMHGHLINPSATRVTLFQRWLLYIYAARPHTQIDE